MARREESGVKKRRFGDVMEFTEGTCGGITAYVGIASVFPLPQDFTARIEEEYGYTADPTHVEERYVRWYIHPPDELAWDFPDGCYTFCAPGRGAFKVYCLDADHTHEMEEGEEECVTKSVENTL